MKIAWDFDGTLTLGGHNIISMIYCVPDVNAIRKINEMKEEYGFEIVIYTARPWWMKRSLAKWLKKHGVTYDSIVTGKLSCDMYVDNKARRVEEV